MVDAGLVHVRQHFLQRQPALQVRMKIHDRVVRAAQPQDFLIARVQRLVDRLQGQIVRERFDPDIAKAYAAVRIVSLQCESAFAQPPRCHGRDLQVIHQQHIIHTHLHAVPFHCDLHGEPGVVRRHLLVHVANAIKTPGFLPFQVIAVLHSRVVHLHLETRRRPVLVLEGGVEINAGVRTGRRFDFHRELEILERGAVDRPGVKQVRPGAMRHDRPVLNFEGAGVFAGFPAVQIPAVK